MIYPSKKLTVALLALVTFCASTVAVSAITITSNSVSVGLGSSAGGGSASFTGTSVPASQLLDVTSGAFYSRTQIDYTGSGNQVTLLNTFSQNRSGNANNNASSNSNVMIFTADANTTYALSGAYSAADVSGADSFLLSSYLQDITTNTDLVNSVQHSFGAINESFLLGGTGANFANYFSGSLTGSLIATHTYKWGFQAKTGIHSAPDGGSLATGFVRLEIGGGAPSNSIPDGGPTLAMLGLTFLTCAALRRKISRN
jgi:hypothetical protein